MYSVKMMMEYKKTAVDMNLSRQLFLFKNMI